MASGFLSRLLGRRGVGSCDVPVVVDRELWLIGDVHGCIDLLRQMLVRIGDHDRGEPRTVVFMGDYVDRGPDSAAVLRCVADHVAGAASDAAIALCGNHERMMLRFLDDPARNGRHWLRFGGLETLASYGIDGLTQHATPGQLRDAAARLRDGIPVDVMALLQAMPARWRNGNVVCVHAGLDPDAAPEGQPDEIAIRGHAAFLDRTRKDGVWVAHGHTIVDVPTARDTRIAVDTGAYRTGRLTAAHLRPGLPPAFVTVT